MIFHGKLTFFLKRKLHLFDEKTHENNFFTEESFRMTDVFCKKCFKIKKKIFHAQYFLLQEKKKQESYSFCQRKNKTTLEKFVLMCETDGKEKKKVISQDFFTFHTRTFFFSNTMFFFMCETVEIFPKAILFFSFVFSFLIFHFHTIFFI